MKNTITGILSLLFVFSMLLGAFGLVGCDNGKDPSASPTPDGGGEVEQPVDISWLKNFNEKIAALSNYYGRPMSVANGGDVKNFAPASSAAIESAIENGADAIGICLLKSSDGVLIALPETDPFGTTDIAAKKGTNGLPSSTSIKSWSYEQIKSLRLLDKDGNVTEYSILTFAEVLTLCKDKCFVFINNASEYESDSYSALYADAKATGAFSSLMVTPGTKVLSEWAKTSTKDIAEAIKNNCEAFYHLGVYFDIRVPATVSDREAGWVKAYSEGKTFMITEDIKGFSEWVAKNFRSALEYQPDEFENLSYSIEKEKLTGRYLLISDIHYNIQDSGSRYVHSVTYRGYHNDERMKLMCEDIEREYNERGLDAIFVLGDLTVDDPPHSGKKNHLQLVWNTYLKPLSEKLGIPVLTLGGNHDGYPDLIWKQVTGTERQHVWVNQKNGDVFILLDTYNPKTATSNQSGSGVGWTGIDEKWLETQLEKYKNNPNVFILSHYFYKGTQTDEFISSETNDLATLVKKYKNVKAMYDAHSHRYKVETIANIPVINTGAYSYDCVYDEKGKVYNFDNLDLNNLWGFNILEVSEDSIVSYRVNTDRYYVTVYDPAEHYNPYTKFEDVVIK